MSYGESEETLPDGDIFTQRHNRLSKPTDIIVPRWVWVFYFSMVVLGAHDWWEAIGGMLMFIVGLAGPRLDHAGQQLALRSKRKRDDGTV